MIKELKKIELELKQLYIDDASAKRVFNWFDERQKDSWEMPVRIAAYRTGLAEYEVRRIFSILQDLGCGTLVTGRRGYETRMQWALSIRSIAAVAKGEAETVEEVSVAPGEALEDEEPGVTAQTVKHTFRLRSDFEIAINLPPDFTSREAERLSTFLRAIPMD